MATPVDTLSSSPQDVHTTEMHCDSTEFCVGPSFRDVLAVSMYQLDEATGVRNGRVQLYRVVHGDGAATLEEAARHDCCGVFDLKWRPDLVQACPLAAVALADGSITFLQVCHYLNSTLGACDRHGELQPSSRAARSSFQSE